MTGFLSPRVARVAAGLAVVCAFAVAPLVAQADATATGTLGAGALSVAAPAITAFAAPLTGVNRSVNTAAGPWSLTDSSGDGAAYHVSVSVGAPTINGTSGDGR